MLYRYKGKLYPEYLKEWRAVANITPAAAHFCKGQGLDIGAGATPYPGAIPIDILDDSPWGAMTLPEGPFDYVFSSHCLEHLDDPIGALELWIARLHPGGVLFLYLPHPDMEYWLPQNNRKHRHAWRPDDVVKILGDLGLCDITNSERDAYWSFYVAGIKPIDGESPETD